MTEPTRVDEPRVPTLAERGARLQRAINLGVGAIAAILVIMVVALVLIAAEEYRRQQDMCSLVRSLAPASGQPTSAYGKDQRHALDVYEGRNC